MNDADNVPLNRQLSDIADQCLAELMEDESPELALREAAYSGDPRRMATMNKFIAFVRDRSKNRTLSMNEHAIAASFFRDVRVFAVSKGSVALFTEAFRREQEQRKAMLLSSRRPADWAAAVMYVLWELTSCYGTSVLRWVLIGLAVPTVFWLSLSGLASSENASTATWISSAFTSVETFAQIAYAPPVDGVGRLVYLGERLLGMVYFAFGFGLLIPRFSMELSRSTRH